MADDKEKKKGRGPRGRRWWMWRLGVSGLIALFLAFLAVPGVLLARQVSNMRHTVRVLEAGNKRRSFPEIRAGVQQLDAETRNALAWMQWMGYLSVVPGIGRQYQDGEHAFRAVDQALRGMNLLMPALDRVAPLLGYRGGSGPEHLRTGKQKISAVVSALPILGPALRRAYPDFVRANRALAAIRPADFHGFLRPLASKVATAQSLVNTAVKNMPLIYQSTSALQNILGDPSPKRFLASHTAAFADPRLQLVTADGMEYLADVEDYFDLILVDCTDPEGSGPGCVLYTEAFHRRVHKALKADGLFIQQSGSPTYNPEVLQAISADVTQQFPVCRVYWCVVPTYPGGLFTFTSGSKQYDLLDFTPVTVPHARWYTPDVHRAAFALPPVVAQHLPESVRTGQSTPL